MKVSERTLRISAASFLALIMVGSAYLLSGPNFLTSRQANAESTEALLKAYATKDSDGDGLPDWEEALYGTDPNKAISNPYGIPDGEAAREGKLTPKSLATQLPSANQGTTTLTSADFGGVPAPAPGSITDQFSKQFLQEFVQASNGQPMDQTTQDQLVSSLASEINQQVSSTLSSNYSLVQVHTNASMTLSPYAAAVESALIQNDVPAAANPYDLMLTAFQSTDTKQVAQAEATLAKISAATAAMATQLRSVSVPVSQANAHVRLVQSLDTLSRAMAIMSNYQKDPLATMGALSAYTTATQSYGQALNQIATSILANGEPAQKDPGYLIVTLARLSH